MSAIDKRNGVYGSGKSDTAETPDDTALKLCTRRDELSYVVRASMRDLRGKCVAAVFGRYEIVTTIVQQLHVATGSQDSHDIDVDGMENSGAHYRDIGDIGSGYARAQAHCASLVGAGRLGKDGNLICAVYGDEGRECKCAILRDRQIVATVVLQNKARATGISRH